MARGFVEVNMHVGRLRLVTLVTVLAAAGCPPDPTGSYSGCRDDGDCLNGYRCVQSGEDTGQCVRAEKGDGLFDAGARDAGRASSSSAAATTSSSSSTATSPAASSSSAAASSSSSAAVSSSSSAAAGGSSSSDGCPLARLAEICGALGYPVDLARCRCAVPAPDAGVVDAGACQVALLTQICDALALRPDEATCTCLPPEPPDAGLTPTDECLSDEDCPADNFCCARQCYPATAQHLDAHCGCLATRVADDGVDCAQASEGRVCLAPDGGPLAALGAGARGLIHSAVCGCTTAGPSADECPDNAGLVGICEDHRCLPQSDSACGADLQPCNATLGGPRCVDVAGTGLGTCTCDTAAPDVPLACGYDGADYFGRASHCTPAAVGAAHGTCECGGAAACAGTAASTCCNTDGDSYACRNLAVEDNSCGLCTMRCKNTGTLGCEMREPSTFPACATDYFAYVDDCRGDNGTALNPMSTTNVPAANPLTPGVYPCSCDTFRAYGQDSACPPGRYCCPLNAAVGAPVGCCQFDCSVSLDAGNSCFTRYGADGGYNPPADGG